MKCLPASKLAQSKGVAIHDWHAEILAIRTFNRYLLDECHKIAVQGASSVIIEPRSFVSSNKDGLATPFQIKKDVKLHMYCSEAPCKCSDDIE
jgi:tRNA-specific adenosine deaminase 1